MTRVERRTMWLVLFRMYVLILAVPTSAAVGLSVRGMNGALLGIGGLVGLVALAELAQRCLPTGTRTPAR